jgi:hypothetical protein
LGAGYISRGGIVCLLKLRIKHPELSQELSAA